MTKHILDELIVPTPPYQAFRAVLAASREKGVVIPNSSVEKPLEGSEAISERVKEKLKTGEAKILSNVAAAKEKNPSDSQAQEVLGNLQSEVVAVFENRTATATKGIAEALTPDKPAPKAKPIPSAKPKNSVPAAGAPAVPTVPTGEPGKEIKEEGAPYYKRLQDEAIKAGNEGEAKRLQKIIDDYNNPPKPRGEQKATPDDGLNLNQRIVDSYRDQQKAAQAAGNEAEVQRIQEKIDGYKPFAVPSSEPAVATEGATKPADPNRLVGDSRRLPQLSDETLADRGLVRGKDGVIISKKDVPGGVGEERVTLSPDGTPEVVERWNPANPLNNAPVSPTDTIRGGGTAPAEGLPASPDVQKALNIQQEKIGQAKKAREAALKDFLKLSESSREDPEAYEKARDEFFRLDERLAGEARYEQNLKNPPTASPEVAPEQEGIATKEQARILAELQQMYPDKSKEEIERLDTILSLPQDRFNFIKAHRPADKAAQTALEQQISSMSESEFEKLKAEEAARTAPGSPKTNTTPNFDTEFPQTPAPDERDYAGEIRIPKQEAPKNLKDNMGKWDYVKEAGRLAVEKTGTRPWFETLWPRAASFFQRRLAETMMLRQERMQSRLERAQVKLEAWTDKFNDGSRFTKMFYSARMRAWNAEVQKYTAKNNIYDTRRLKFQERHNELLGEVVERYDQELQPYKAIAEGLKSKENALLQAQKLLTADLETAKAQLSAAQAASAGKWFIKPKARAAIKKIQGTVKELSRRVSATNKDMARVRAPLSRAEGAIDKWQAKKNTVIENMKFPEAAGLGRIKRTELKAPERRASNFVPDEIEEIETPKSKLEKERLAEEWTVNDFVESWNTRNLKPEVDRKEFFKYFLDKRKGEKEEPTRGQILDLAEQYLRERSSASEMKQFRKDRAFFITQVEKPKPTP